MVGQGKMAANARRLPPKPVLDKWSVREQLALASSVQRSGDQNWVSVSRTIKLYGEQEKPADWFSQKNCALQYGELLEKVETPKRKRGEKNEVVEAPADQIVRKLSIERIEELKKLVLESQQKYKQLKRDIETVRSGQLDDNLTELWERMETDRKEREAKAEAEKAAIQASYESPATPVPGAILLKVKKPKIKIPRPGEDETTRDSIASETGSLEGEVEDLPSAGSSVSDSSKSTTQSSSLKPAVDALKPDSNLENQNGEVASAVPSTVKTETTLPTSPSQGAPTLSKLLHSPPPQARGPAIQAVMEKVIAESPARSSSLGHAEESIPTVTKKDIEKDITGESVSAADRSMEDVQTKDEAPLSPASSVSSRISDTGQKAKKRQSRTRPQRPGSRRSSRVSRKTDEDKTSSRADSSDEHSEDETSNTAPSKHLSSFTESIANSPASMSQCSDTEEEKNFRIWKKSIMLVYRAAANHKFANVFLHPVTDDIAPGYASVVLRPMDLSTIKKNIENGAIRTTQEFQRDMMLMFTNALMYNSSDQVVYDMAVKMFDDVMQNIEEFLSTQVMAQSNETKVLRGTRRSEASDKEEEGTRRRTSTEHEKHTSGGKAKKRKTRADD